MPRSKPIVHCVFTKNEKNLPELLEESFRLYLHRILAGGDHGEVQ